MYCTHICQGEEWKLLPEKAVYWLSEKMLIVSDLHIGKISHFRKAGIAIPNNAKDENLETLSYLYVNHEIEKVIFLGDLFHSTKNQSTEVLKQFLSNFPAIEHILIKGNHDLYSDAFYNSLNLLVVDKLSYGPFVFTHIPEELKTGYNVCGHIHPAVRLFGKARSAVRLPCFFFGKKRAIMPSFGVFTGSHTIKPSKTDDIYAILPSNKVQYVSGE